ncbi:3-methyl-2-oxobutanoate hydroxymethyltransferase [Sulfuriferula nivalis]|uniref:3-methyl-2-oxobutanoate hydroxymethyltransferase n=1 Tax=Sulfuriferula nivalis TaxID=2675298 RepID=A0A809S3C6_9PROT|nr:3-methyl-2-oxobutanoate hydroxymethyltransferase [Sulfuriferula nivalis]BBP01258.1 3-methyl-2-oxobutanoate hydroxymethyltransferase [Sulfuriferula nivalis]
MTNLITLQQRAQQGEKLAVLTCYDASFASLMANAGVDAILVGDSLGMVIQGQRSTLPVTLTDMVYHTRAVAAGAPDTFIITDLPFGSYQASPEQALISASALMSAGAHCVKLEGGAVMASTVAFLTQRGIPVCGHLGLLPQSVNTLGGYKVQGKTDAAAQQLIADAELLAASGAAMIVLEAIPATLAAQITSSIAIPTIGIGAGVDCNGQVLVLYDMLGLGKPPRFSHNFLQSANSLHEAVTAYVDAVKTANFPTEQHSFK